MRQTLIEWQMPCRPWVSGRCRANSLADRDGWEAAELPVAQADSWSIDQLVHDLQGDIVELVDVREVSEWTTRHPAGPTTFRSTACSDITELQLSQNCRTTAVACAARAVFAASPLRRAGRRIVVRVAGGGVPDPGAGGLEFELGRD